MATKEDTVLAEAATKRDDIPEGWLGLLLAEVLVSYGRNFRIALEEYGITHAQFRHLTLLFLHGPLTPVELSDRVGVKKASSTAVIQSLVERKLIRRTPDAGDRRKVNLSLTAKGNDLVERLSRSAKVVNTHAREGIPDRDYAATVKVLRRMIGNLNRLSEEGDPEALQALICPKRPKR